MGTADQAPAPVPLGGGTLRVCVAGAGAISLYHLRGWREIPGIELSALCDPVPERAQERAKEFGISRVYRDFRAMLEAECPHAVDIITPVGTHAELTLLAAERGVHVSCQKPLTPTVAQARDLIAQVGQRVRFMVHENYRFRPHYRDVARRLAAGAVGEVLHARMSVRSASVYDLTAQPPLLARQPYLAKFPRLLIFEVLIHHLDVLRTLLGPLRVASAHIARVSPLIAGEDVALITLEGPGGMTVLLDGHISALGAPPMPTDRLEILGSRGTLIYDGDRLSQPGSEVPLVIYDLAANYQACFTGAIADFVAGLRTGTAFQTDRLDNLKTLELMEASYAAAQPPLH